MSTGGGGRGGRGPGLGEIPEMKRRIKMSRRMKSFPESFCQWKIGVRILADVDALDENRVKIRSLGFLVGRRLSQRHADVDIHPPRKGDDIGWAFASCSDSTTHVPKSLPKMTLNWTSFSIVLFTFSPLIWLTA